MSEASGMDLDNQIQTFEQQAQDYKKELYSKLKPSQKLQIARHPERPKFLDYVDLICEDFIELHGDREGMDDRAIIGGIAKLNGKPVMIIGIQKVNLQKKILNIISVCRSLRGTEKRSDFSNTQINSKCLLLH